MKSWCYTCPMIPVTMKVMNTVSWWETRYSRTSEAPVSLLILGLSTNMETCSETSNINIYSYVHIMCVSKRSHTTSLNSYKFGWFDARDFIIFKKSIGPHNLHKFRHWNVGSITNILVNNWNFESTYNIKDIYSFINKKYCNNTRHVRKVSTVCEKIS